MQSKRCARWERYYDELLPWALKSEVRLPTVPDHCTQPYHLFYLILPSLEIRQRLIEHLKIRGIMGVFHYLPLHLSPMGRSFGGRPGACPVTEDVSDRLLRLPLYWDLSPQDQERIVTAIREFRW